MKKVSRIVSTAVSVLFIFSCILPDASLAFDTGNAASNTLAVPSAYDDLAGIQQKDVGRIQLALEAQLMTIAGKGLPFDASTFVMMQDISVAEKTVFNPAHVQFCFRSSEKRGDNILVKCKVMEASDFMPRVYYALFSKERDDKGGFQIDVYTDKEYTKFGHLLGIVRPERKPEDRRAIERYVQHEKGVDEVIRYAHDKGLAREPIKNRFDYRREVLSILKTLKIDVKNPNGLTPIEDRQFFLVPLAADIRKKVGELPKVKIVDKSGVEHEVDYYAHSSNNAVHIFVEQFDYDRLTDPKYTSYVMESTQDSLRGWLVHEVGAMLGQEFSMEGTQPFSFLDERYRSARFFEQPINSTTLSIVDLDANLMTRDYAASGGIEVRGQNKDDLLKIYAGLPNSRHDGYEVYAYANHFLVLKYSADKYRITHDEGEDGWLTRKDGQWTFEPLKPGSSNMEKSASEPVLPKEALELGADQTPNPSALKILAESKSVKEEVGVMRELASGMELMIPTHSSKRYTLLMAAEFFDKGELEEHRNLYGDLFNLDRISGVTPEQFIDNIIGKANGIGDKTIALIPNEIKNERQLQRLTAAGIRFIRTDMNILRDMKSRKDAHRKKFQLDTYVTMLLARRIDDQEPEDSPIYRLLAFYLKSHFALDGGNGPQAIRGYIDAIRKNDITGLLKGILSYRPIEIYDAAKDYESIAKVLISA